ncbi:MAG: hypothetical protein WKF60_03255 [Ilumatobacter sp.]|jgi:hypothetical protein
MSKRNLIWLVAIIVVGVIVWIAAGFLWALLAAAVTLVASEAVERTARKRRVAAKGAAPIRPLRGALRRDRD